MKYQFNKQLTVQIFDPYPNNREIVEAKKKPKSSDNFIVKTINGVNFYNKIEMLYKSYEKGNIAIGLDINKDGPKCFALLPNNLAVQTLVMSCPKLERCFYDICLYSSKHSIRNYPLKLFFDIEQKGPDGKKTLITDQILNVVIQTI